MPLEAGTYVSDLVVGNPDGTDERSEGDDHLRLIKKVLQTTFPNADRAFYFPEVKAVSAGYTVLASDHNAFIAGDTTSGNFTILLPSSGALFIGFQVRIMKSDSSGNNITVDGNGADTINGSLTTSVSSQYVVKTFIWSGSEWFTW
jgi:hypothetical protein